MLSLPKPRVLFVSFRLRYINPTRELFYEALRRACDLTTFGPGYVSLVEVEAGPERFVDRHGPFDIVVADEFSLLRDKVPEDRKHDHKFVYQACDFDPLLIHEGHRYYNFLKAWRGPRVVSMVCSDYQGYTPDFVEQIEEIGDYFFTWGTELITRKAAVPPELVKGQKMNETTYNHWNDNYFEFVSRHAARTLSLPHLIGDGEFSATPLSRRRYDWSVMGADYESRLEARRLIDGAGISRSGKYHPYIFSAMKRLRIHPYNKPLAIDALILLFQHAIRVARYGFTCGGACRWPIRKYFEIPASGAVLAAERCYGFDALGFSNKVNALETDARDIVEAHAWLQSDLERAQGIADAGRALVRNKHSVGARACQLTKSFERILSGTFAGSFWDRGDLCFRETAAMAPAAQ